MKVRRLGEGLLNGAASLPREDDSSGGVKSGQERVRRDDAQGELRIELSLGRAIQAQLDPASLAAERRARVEALKQQVQNGTYQIPPSDLLAARVGEEISLEVLSFGGLMERDE